MVGISGGGLVCLDLSACAVQGPCHGNQQALATSRLWDATPGFLKLFASLQWKLGKVGGACVWVGLM